MSVTMKIEGGAELAKTLDGLSARLSKKVMREALENAGEPIRKDMQIKAPRAPGAPDIADHMVIGTARGNKTTTAVAIGPAKGFFYGCVFDAKTCVTTDIGPKAICQIKVGDKVLTQTGEFRAVLKTFKYPAIEKPDLVTITARYRKGRDHELTLTRDHKVLTFRDEKYQWVKAEDIVVGDVLTKRRKTSWSAGTAKTEARICEGCGDAYVRRARGRAKLAAGFSQGLRFCSTECRSTWLAQHHRGMKRSDQTKTQLSELTKARLLKNPESHPNRVMAAKGFTTACEKAVADWLNVRGVEFREQHQIGRSFVDFFLPESNTVIEADGAYWHRDQQRDIVRDRRILEDDPTVRIVHMHFVDPRFTPQNLDRQPLPNVSYVPCNPGPSSFADPDVFTGTPVLSIKHWRYEPKGKTCASLYDITVDGVHSFVASGLVIHNSFLEFGTIFMGARPFARPAFDAGVSKALAEIVRATWTALAARGISRSSTSSTSVQSDGPLL